MLFGSIIGARLLFAHPEPQGSTLAGTSWQLVKFHGSNDSTITPDERAKYTITFEPDGRLDARIDCNRGRGTWKSSRSNQLEFGPLALTRATCPPGSLHDQIVKHFPYVRSYTLRGGHLFLALMADGGIYELEPISSVRESSLQRGVQGTATYRERMALPPNALLEATLEDVSNADGRAELIARVRNERPGNPPIPFLIAFDPSRVIPSHRYAVRARIYVGGKLLFATDQGHPVLTGRGDSALTLVLRRVGSSPPAPPSTGSTAAPALENIYWKLTHLADAPVATASEQQEPHFVLHPETGRVSGTAGCNQFGGSYEVRNNQLTFRGIVGTLKACVTGMDTEKAFLAALGRVNQWKVADHRLELFDGAGKLLARFEERLKR
jgi:putative lipoprotein